MGKWLMHGSWKLALALGAAGYMCQRVAEVHLPGDAAKVAYGAAYLLMAFAWYANSRHPDSFPTKVDSKKKKR